MQAKRAIAVIFCSCLCALAMPECAAVAWQTDAGYLSVTGPCRLTFPDDHGEHPGYRTEWWYYTGNLRTEPQHSFGFQLTIFRRRISPPRSLRSWPDLPSRWRTSQIYLGHAAVTDVDGARHLFAESAARSALGLSGVRQSGDRTTVFLNKWSIDIQPEVHRLQAGGSDFSFDLQLHPLKPVVMHGDQGYSRKGDGTERASCYYSYTRLQSTGSIRLGEKVFAVKGYSWMDHEFSTAPLQPGIDGWDWFSLQLADGSDLMIYRLRQAGGGLHPASSGTLIEAGGEAVGLSASDFQVDVLHHWKSPHSGATYPSGWRLRVDRAAIDIVVNTRLSDQELQTGATTGVTYWEGSVSASGTAKGRPVEGKGYVELTGYAGGMESLQ